MFWPPCCKVLKDTWLYFFSLLQGALSDLSKRIHSCAVVYMQSCIFFGIFADADIDTGALGEQSWAEVAAMSCFHSGFNYRHGWEFYGLGHNISNPEKYKPSPSQHINSLAYGRKPCLMCFRITNKGLQNTSFQLETHFNALIFSENRQTSCCQVQQCFIWCYTKSETVLLENSVYCRECFFFPFWLFWLRVFPHTNYHMETVPRQSRKKCIVIRKEEESQHAVEINA